MDKIQSKDDLEPRSSGVKIHQIHYVQIEGLALMKIIKHCHEEGDSSIEVAQGALLGMVVNNRLEITNCFAFPKNYDDDEGDFTYDVTLFIVVAKVCNRPIDRESKMNYDNLFGVCFKILAPLLRGGYGGKIKNVHKFQKLMEWQHFEVLKKECDFEKNRFKVLVTGERLASKEDNPSFRPEHLIFAILKILVSDKLDMMRNLKLVNVDHYHVGWYQSSEIGSFLSASLLESQFHYQISIEESVVLIFDNAKTDRGFLALKAYRLTPQAIAMYKEGEFTLEAVKNHKVGYENVLLEIPLRIRNSSLTNILLSDLGVLIPPQEGNKFLDLGSANVLENQVRSLMDCVDDLNQETMKFNRFQQAVARQMQEKNKYLQKVAQENAVRASKDEPPLPEEDLSKLFKALPVPTRLLPITLAGKVEAYSQNLSEFCLQSLAKLYLVEALHSKKT